MNLTDARLITTAAVTSAAVALATVAVYEGHVKLSSAGQTIVVAPGATYEVQPGKPPRRRAEHRRHAAGGGACLGAVTGRRARRTDRRIDHDP